MLREQERTEQSKVALGKAASLRRKLQGGVEVPEHESEAEAEREYDGLNLWMLW